MTYREWLAQAAECFSERGIEDSGPDAWLLLSHGTGIDRLYYSLNGGEEIPEGQLAGLEELKEKRCSRIPVQQLIGEAWFMGYPFYVNEHVLIPRQDTEVLAEYALGVLAEKTDKRNPDIRVEGQGECGLGKATGKNAGAGRPLRVLDLCTGSGCILLSILKEMPGISGTGTDISLEALAVAEENAARLGAEASFLQSDLWERVEGTYDLIVSNPPYIARKVIGSLEPEVRKHEPILALDGGKDGLDFYRRIVGQAAEYLEYDGELSVEIGYDQGEAVSALMKENGFTDVRVIRDLAGLDRVAAGKRRG
ncbi:MAG TPA: peptide chain release factor N(5)-glutamine methyltransferase [Lachnospiraceae bacterium]|nr:peptide chain release factor N(5)-glutamine methyltransferase [Lachnospiraceae bacterium]